MTFLSISQHLLIGILSFAACLAIVLTKPLHGRLTLDSLDGIQRAHSDPTPRVGGVPILLSLVLAAVLSAQTPMGQILVPLLLAGVPAFFMGLIEDLFKRGNIVERLGGTFVSALLACWLMGTSLQSVGVIGLDSLLAMGFVSVAFTAFAVAGIANAVNIIDGVNGLASGAVAIALLGLGAIAFQVGDAPMGALCVVLAVAILGFLLVNFPFGKIFLGDGGAYFLGFALGWIAVLLPTRNPEVSPWACFLVCGYPVIETIFSILRRVKRRLHVGEPDRLHLHSLVRARWVERRLAGLPKVLRNSATSLPLWAYSGAMAVVGAYWFDHAQLMVLCVFAASAFYWVWYLRLVRFVQEYQPAR